jgi:hypothetical protein
MTVVLAQSSAITILEFWNLLKAWDFRGGLDGKLQLILVHVNSQHHGYSPFPSLNPMEATCAHALGAAFTHLEEVGLDKKDPLLQILGVCALIVDRCFDRTGARSTWSWFL